MPDLTFKTEHESNNLGLSIIKRTLLKSYPIHMHDFYELEYVVSGEGKVIINDNLMSFKAGSILFMTPLDTEEVILEENMNVEIYNFTIHSSWIDDNICNAFANGVVLNDFPPYLINRLIEEYQRKDNYNLQIARYILNCIIVDIIRTIYSNKLISISQTTNPSSYIFKSIKFIHKNFKEPITEKDVAEYIGLSPNYFCSKFHKETGKSFKKFLNQLRLNHSSKLLKSSNLSIVNVAFSSGFSDISSFYHLFKKSFKVSPLQYRKAHITDSKKISFDEMKFDQHPDLLSELED